MFVLKLKTLLEIRRKQFAEHWPAARHVLDARVEALARAAQDLAAIGGEDVAAEVLSAWAKKMAAVGKRPPGRPPGKTEQRQYLQEVVARMDAAARAAGRREAPASRVAVKLMKDFDIDPCEKSSLTRAIQQERQELKRLARRRR